ncbi:patatin-like phospholipase family protein [Mesorhizobium sp. KR9-304]|uniref:patatin-like phospholipase family protein n=1 Tax=Mesorhizobium sp. KR9-304 TaxID=3156614 RepID=UPI0032B54326
MSSTDLSPRDRHLFGPGPKTILSLDGGGVRGAISIAFLERMEALLGHGGQHRRLGDFFDLIGGTSTGAIIGAGLALGLSAEEMRSFYVDLAPRIFRRPFWRVAGLQAKFDSLHLKKELAGIIGDRKLDSEDLKTGFCLVMKRMDKGSPWILSNNPRARYWADPDDGSYIGNRHYHLASLIRASTAAPHYFDPEPLTIVEGEEDGLFVDGGVTPYNNPALHLFLLATLPQHGICWNLGPRDLTIVSIGTGRFSDKITIREVFYVRAIGLAIRALAGLISDTQTLTLGLMQALGETPTPWQINSEVGTMQGLPLPGGPLFRHVRYDVRLDRDWLEENLEVKLDERTVRRLRAMDDPSIVPLAYEIGQLAAERQVQLEHFARPA